MTRARVRRPLILLTVLGLLAGLVGSPVAAAPPAGKGHPSNTAVFFASDGMRQDLVAKYAAQGLMPTMASFLKNGTSATGDGLLTEAPPNTGAGWYSLATGAWPGVHGSTNNTFHINGANFANSTSAFASGIMQAEIDRPERRAGRPQGRPGRLGRRRQLVHPGPHDRLPVVLLRPRRGHELHRHGDRRPVRRPRVHRRLRAPVRHPRRLRRPGGLPRAAPTDADRLDRRARVVQPGQGDAAPGPRLRDRQVRPQRLHLRQHERRDHELRQGPLLEDEERRGPRRRRDPGQGPVGRRQGHDRRRRRWPARRPACSSRSRS